MGYPLPFLRMTQGLEDWPKQLRRSKLLNEAHQFREHLQANIELNVPYLPAILLFRSYCCPQFRSRFSNPKIPP
jgi:hypothetical protein